VAEKRLPYCAWAAAYRPFHEADRLVVWSIGAVPTYVHPCAPSERSFRDARVSQKQPWYKHDFTRHATLLSFTTVALTFGAFFGLLISISSSPASRQTCWSTALIRYPLRLLTLQQSPKVLSLAHAPPNCSEKKCPYPAPRSNRLLVGNANTQNSTIPGFDSAPTANNALPILTNENLGRDYNPNQSQLQ